MQIKPAAGFSLLEVLIAMAVITIALINLARLQAATIHTARQAVAFELVHQLAAELAEWIRVSESATTLLAVIAEQGTSASISCYNQNCTPQQFARFEWHEWRQRVLHIAPAARISVCRSDHIPLVDWHCSTDDDLTSPLIIRIGWPQVPKTLNFPPAVTVTVGPVPP